MNASLQQSERMGKSPNTCFAKMLEGLCGRQKGGGKKKKKIAHKITSPSPPPQYDHIPLELENLYQAIFRASQPTAAKCARVSVANLKESENKTLNKINDMEKQSQPQNCR